MGLECILSTLENFYDKDEASRRYNLILRDFMFGGIKMKVPEDESTEKHWYYLCQNNNNESLFDGPFDLPDILSSSRSYQKQFKEEYFDEEFEKTLTDIHNDEQYGDCKTIICYASEYEGKPVFYTSVFVHAPSTYKNVFEKMYDDLKKLYPADN